MKSQILPTIICNKVEIPKCVHLLCTVCDEYFGSFLQINNENKPIWFKLHVATIFIITLTNIRKFNRNLFLPWPKTQNNRKMLILALLLFIAECQSSCYFIVHLSLSKDLNFFCKQVETTFSHKGIVSWFRCIKNTVCQTLFQKEISWLYA